MRPSEKAREIIEQIRIAWDVDQVEAILSGVGLLEGGDDEEHIRVAAEEKLEDLRSA